MDCDIILRPILPTVFVCAAPPPPPLTVLYKISIDCSFFSCFFSNTGVELIKCSAALFTGCMLVMYNRVMYACVHLALWSRYVLFGKSDDKNILEKEKKKVFILYAVPVNQRVVLRSLGSLCTIMPQIECQNPLTIPSTTLISSTGLISGWLDVCCLTTNIQPATYFHTYNIRNIITKNKN